MKSLLIVLQLAASGAPAASSSTDFSKVYQLARKLEVQPNPVFAVPSGQLQDDELFFIAEIHAGSVNKNELRTATGQVILDRVLCPRPVLGQDGATVAPYPAHYGISPGRFSFDGDPLDLVVFGSNDEYSRLVRSGTMTARKVRVIGVMQMEECGDVPCRKDVDWENDWKVVGVDLADAKYKKLKTIAELPASDREQLDRFFGNYKGPEEGFPQTRVNGYLQAKEALVYIRKFPVADFNQRRSELRDCKHYYDKVLTRISKLQDSDRPDIDTKYVKCLGRVFDARFFESANTFSSFKSYSAYQILKKEGKGSKKMTIGTALLEMEKRRAKKKKHYRFVYWDKATPGTDVASQGSGDLILEWVKTKDRNTGCPAGFKPQHYDVQPLSAF